VVDAGTGTGQAIQPLSKSFLRVVAFDPSPQQAAKASKLATAALPGKDVSVFSCGAEAFAAPCGLSPSSVDVVTAFQAAHWFELDRFYSEAASVLKPGGLVALVGYGNNILRVANPLALESSSEVQAAERRLQLEWAKMYHTLLGKHWDSRRAPIDTHYRGFSSTNTDLYCDTWRNDTIVNSLPMPVSGYAGYVATWSSFQTLSKLDPDQAKRALCEMQEAMTEILRGSDVLVEWPVFVVYSRRAMRCSKACD